MRMAAAAMVTMLALAPAAAAAPAACTINQLLELKVTMEGMGPMTRVGINGHPERFLVDSGAFFSTISQGKAAELGLHLEALPVDYTVSGVGGDMNASLAVVKTVDLAGVAVPNIRFIVGGGEIGGGAGLLGQNVLGIGDVEYDLAHGAIRIVRPKGCKDDALAYWAGNRAVSTVAVEPRGERQSHTIGAVTVNGTRMRAIFDTGASGTVMSLAAAARIGLKPDGPGVRPGGYSHGVGRRQVPSYIVPIDSIRLGDQEEIRNTHLRAADLGTLGADMLIGADFFLSHRVYVANGLRRLFFTYDGGPIFNVTPGRIVDQAGAAVEIAADAAAPADAAGYRRRGAALAARRDYPGAIAALDKAVAMAPAESRYLYQRAEAHS